MEKQKPGQGGKSSGGNQRKDSDYLEHDVTVMMSEPMKVRLPYGATYSDLLKKVEEELGKKGKKLDPKSSAMLNGKTVEPGENPVLIKASVLTLTQKISGGN